MLRSFGRLLKSSEINLTEWNVSCLRWLKPLFSIGLKRPITDDDTHNVLHTMHSDSNTEQLLQLWELEKKRRKPNLLCAIMHLYGYKMTLAGLAFAVMDAVARYVKLCARSPFTVSIINSHRIFTPRFSNFVLLFGSSAALFSLIVFAYRFRLSSTDTRGHPFHWLQYHPADMRGRFRGLFRASRRRNGR